ncbi:glycosyltransferase [Plantactinospora soyae]|uniref:Glycosyltransferase involved in cell wall biosynthesis n=1 Tax=Plantactinospora soyae TaxID=1544732 RepID=A0A927MDS2_9ACTN|nr:glycosyltransferase [Plantactinospora soyae]MBE1489235.1 glycosyltransferase involved in cell wall biosynthesis [Plantactinospora soyae]
MSASRGSVIVTTYNRAELLGYTLASVTRQTLPVDRFEVLMCDDGSTDDTAAVVDRFQDRLDITRLFHEHDGFGASRSRNEFYLRYHDDFADLPARWVMLWTATSRPAWRCRGPTTGC